EDDLGCAVNLSQNIPNLFTASVDAGTDLNICSGTPVTLTATGQGQFSWSNGVVDGQSFVPATTQTYTVTATDANNCTATDQVTVTVVQSPIADFTSDYTGGNPGLAVNFDNTSSGGMVYDWNFGNGTTAS